MENIKKTITFSTVTYADLQAIVKLKKVLNYAKFEEWFGYPYEMNAEETGFLHHLIQKNALFLASYHEEKLKAKMIIPILNKVDFMFKGVQDWYEETLTVEINQVILTGATDYMIARGEKEPVRPYFFLQEFKPSTPARNPEDQLLAELLASLVLNQTRIMRGAYIIGQNWYFMIAEQCHNDAYEYVVSRQFDSLDVEDLQHIYINLQSIKYQYCQD